MKSLTQLTKNNLEQMQNSVLPDETVQKIPISLLNLDDRTRNGLENYFRRRKITLADIFKVHPNDLLKTKNFGRKSLANLYEAITGSVSENL